MNNIEEKKALQPEIKSLYAKIEERLANQPPEEEKLKRLLHFAHIKEDFDRLTYLREKFMEIDAKFMEKLVFKEVTQPMSEMGLEEAKLASGKKLIFKKHYHAKIPSKHQLEAFQWLDDNGYGDAVKSVVKSEFGTSSENKLEEMKKTLEEKGFMFDINKSIHSSRLKSIVKTTMEEGKEIPMETFGIHIREDIEIK